jgi:hypothetical protein
MRSEVGCALENIAAQGIAQKQFPTIRESFLYVTNPATVGSSPGSQP